MKGKGGEKNNDKKKRFFFFILIYILFSFSFFFDKAKTKIKTNGGENRHACTNKKYLMMIFFVDAVEKLRTICHFFFFEIYISSYINFTRIRITMNVCWEGLDDGVCSTGPSFLSTVPFVIFD